MASPHLKESHVSRHPGSGGGSPGVCQARLTGNRAHKSIHIDAATLQQYAGRYRLVPGTAFHTRWNMARIKAQLTGQTAYPVFASATDEFYYTVADAQLSFERGADGKVDALVLHQDGADRTAKRLP